MSLLGPVVGGLRAGAGALRGPASQLGKLVVPAVGLGALPHLYDLSRYISGGRLPEFGGQQATSSQPPAGSVPPSNGQQPPSQGAFNEQSAELIALLRQIAERDLALSESEQKQRAELYDKLLDPGLYAERAAIDQANWARQQALAQSAGMEQTEALTRRKIEGDVIGAWRGITEAQINADSRIAQGMMNLAYAAGVPNPNVLQAGASLAGQGAAGFTAPKSTIS